MQQLPVEQLLRLLQKEIIRNRVAVTVAFSLISILLISIGIVWPNRYSAATLILAEDQVLNNDSGKTAPAGMQRDRVNLAKELIFSQKIMDEVMRDAKLINDQTAPIEREKLFAQVQKNTDIARTNQTLLKIQYTSTDPVIAYLVTKSFGEVFIRESTEDTQKKAVEEFNFYENQVREYSKKLMEADEKRKTLSIDNISAAPVNEAEVNARINTIRLRIEQSQLELSEAEIRKKSIEDQLSGEAEVTMALTREGQIRQRIGELQQEMETLRLTYHDTYPDIIRIKHQIEDLKESITSEQQRVEQAKKSKQPGIHRLDDSAMFNPLYQQLRNDLSTTKTLLATLRTRISDNQALLNKEIERAKRIHDVELELSSVTRDYGANRAHYEGLLRSRDNARDTMNKLLNQQGATLTIKEPATIPLTPTGLRFVHFAIGGIILGIIIPLLVIYGLIQLDPRIRAESVVNEKLKILVLASIPRLYSPADIQKQQYYTRLIYSILATDAIVYIIIGALKLSKVV